MANDKGKQADLRKPVEAGSPVRSDEARRWAESYSGRVRAVQVHEAKGGKR